MLSSSIIKIAIVLFLGMMVQPVLLVAQTNSPASRHIILEFNTDSAYVVKENRFSKVDLVYSGDTLSYDPNITTFLRVAVPDRPPVIKELDDISGRFNKLSIKLEKSKSEYEILENNHAAEYLSGKNVVIETDAKSKVYYNWDYMGTGTQALRVGNRISTIEVVHPEKGKETKRITINLNKMNYFNMYQEYSKNQIQFAGVLPGFSQYRKGEYLKMTAVLGVMGYAAYKMNDISGDDKPFRSEFFKLREVYEYTENEEVALRTAKELNRLKSKIADIDNEFRLWTGILFTTYALNLMDAFFIEPEGGYRKDNKFRVNVHMVDGKPMPAIGFKADF